jgi:hypothetical protein
MRGVSKRKEPPEVDAYEHDGHLLILCPFCGSGHQHGVAGGGGHRCSHCSVPDSEGGYVLVHAGKASREFVRAWGEARRLAAKEWRRKAARMACPTA